MERKNIKNKNKIIFLIILMFLIILTSCKFDYPDIQVLNNNSQNNNYDNSTFNLLTTVDSKIDDFITLFSPWIQIANATDFYPRDGAGIVSLNGTLFLLGGWKSSQYGTCSEVWKSEDDGYSWTKIADAPWPARHCAGFVIFNNKIWVISGDGCDDVWCSEDGINWECKLNNAPWGKRYAPYVAVFKNKLWLMGGLNFWDENGNYPNFTGAYNDIWCSEDGTNWIRVKLNAPWAPRGLIHGYIVLNDKLYILGGGIKGSIDGQLSSETVAEYNDVWVTEDGINWIRILASAPWRPRTHFSCISDGTYMYVTDGSVGTQANLSNEVWISKDGINWKEIKNTPWSPRHASSIVIHKGFLYIIAGYFINDVWRCKIDYY